MEGLFVLILCSVYVAVQGSSVPFITPCHSTDIACMKSSAQRAVPKLAVGLPDLNVRPLDPMRIDQVTADQAGLSLEFRKTTVKGLRNCAILNLKQQGGRQTVELKCSVVLIGEYTIGGTLITLPVSGDGKYKIKIRDIIVKVVYDVVTRTVGGKDHWSIASWSFTSDLRGGAEFQFQNLFGGNKQLSQSVHEFANTNWKDIFQEVAPPIVKAIVDKIIQEIKKFFDKVPKNELSLD